MEEHSGWKRVVKENTRFSSAVDENKLNKLLNPGKMYFKKGGFSEGIAEALKHMGKEPVVELVWDPVVELLASKGALKRVGGENALGIKKLFVFTGFSSDPHSHEVAKAIIHAHENKADVLLAIGGGSSIDVAKAVNVGLKDSVIRKHLEEKPADLEAKIVERLGVYLNGEIEPEEIKMKLPLIAVPTTSGTGSEVTPVSVITNSLNHEKRLIFGSLVPTHVVLDPKLTYSMPKEVTRNTGADAFVQAVESYIHTEAGTPETRELALNAIRLMHKNFHKSIEGDEDARGKMYIASTLAGIAFANSGLGPVHDLGEATASIFSGKMPHGESCSRYFLHVLNHYVEKGKTENAKNAERSKRIAEIGKEMMGTEVTAEQSIERMRSFLETVGAKTSMVDLDLKEDQIDEIVGRARLLGLSDETHPNHMDVPDMTSKDYESIVRKAAGK